MKRRSGKRKSFFLFLELRYTHKTRDLKKTRDKFKRREEKWFDGLEQYKKRRKKNYTFFLQLTLKKEIKLKVTASGFNEIIKDKWNKFQVVQLKNKSETLF